MVELPVTVTAMLFPVTVNTPAVVTVRVSLAARVTFVPEALLTLKSVAMAWRAAARRSVAERIVVVRMWRFMSRMFADARAHWLRDNGNIPAADFRRFCVSRRHRGRTHQSGIFSPSFFPVF